MPKPQPKQPPKAQPTVDPSSLFEPFEALHDLVTGKIFDGEEPDLEADEEEPEAKPDPDEKRAAPTQQQQPTVNITNVFRRAGKRKPAAAPDSEKGTGKAAGEQDQSEE